MKRFVILVFMVSGQAAAAQSELGFSFSAYVGGMGYDQVRDVCSDTHGNIYVTGGTSSADFPVTMGQPLNHSGEKIMDAFVAKYSPTGELLWSTLLGGDGYDRAYAMETDDSGNVYIAGRAGINLPVTTGAFQTTFMGDDDPNTLYGKQDGFVAKFSTHGELRWCGYFGGADRGFIRDIALDRPGNIFVVETETSGEHPHITANALQKKNRGGYDAVVAKISNDGRRVIWATYLGGSGDDFFGPSIKVNRHGEAVVIGTVFSSDMPTAPPCLAPTLSGECDIFIATLNENGERLTTGTYLGGSGMEGTETHNLALDRCGNIIVAATTSSADFPTTAGAYQRKYGGTGGAGLGANTNYPFDAFVTKLNREGTTLMASTFFGDTNGEAAEGVAVDASENIYITGATFSTGILNNNEAGFQWQNHGKGDAFVAKFDESLGRVSYFNCVGGTAPDYGRALHVSATGSVFIAGETSSESLPKSTNMFGKGGLDGFLAVFNATAPSAASVPAHRNGAEAPCE